MADGKIQDGASGEELAPSLSQLGRRFRVFFEDGYEAAPRADRHHYEELRGSMGERIYLWGRRPPEGITPARWLAMPPAERAALPSDGWLIAASCEESTKRLGRLRRFAGAIRFSGSVVLFPAEQIDQVARLVRARRRRMLSPEQRQRLVEAAAKARFARRKNALHGPRSA